MRLITNTISNFIQDKVVLLKSSAIIDIGNIRFVGSHFPFIKDNVKKSADVGKQALDQILKTNTNDKLMFIFGDLNFRKLNKDQNLLSKKFLQNFTNIQNVTFQTTNTCKTLKKDKQPSDISSICINKPSDHVCFDNTREASKCDRLLIVNKLNTNISKSTAEVITFSPIDESDHYAVYAQVSVPISLLTQQGGVYKKTKERILIGKRNAVVYRSADKQNSRLKYIRKKGEWVKI